MLNETIKRMTEHTSVRDFERTALSEVQKEALLLALQSGATSHHVQAFSLIEIKNQKVREELMEISGSAHVMTSAGFYVFVADLYRQAVMLEKAGKTLEGIQNIEALTVAVVDATIAAQNVAVAAESMELGICYIGGIRNNVSRVAELLKLPKYTFPLFGMCIGVPASRNDRKPRFSLYNQVSEDSYDIEKFTDLEAFDVTMRNYYSSRNSQQKETTWTEQMTDYLDHENRVDLAEFLQKQGFLLN